MNFLFRYNLMVQNCLNKNIKNILEYDTYFTLDRQEIPLRPPSMFLHYQIGKIMYGTIQNIQHTHKLMLNCFKL